MCGKCTLFWHLLTIVRKWLIFTLFSGDVFDGYGGDINKSFGATNNGMPGKTVADAAAGINIVFTLSLFASAPASAGGSDGDPRGRWSCCQPDVEPVHE
jgi:hypothetical protein